MQVSVNQPGYRRCIASSILWSKAIDDFSMKIRFERRYKLKMLPKEHHTENIILYRNIEGPNVHEPCTSTWWRFIFLRFFRPRMYYVCRVYLFVYSCRSSRRSFYPVACVSNFVKYTQQTRKHGSKLNSRVLVDICSACRENTIALSVYVISRWCTHIARILALSRYKMV